MGAAALKIADESPNLRAQFAERITAAWHKSREKILALGNALIEAKQKLPHGEFTAMLESDLPFGPRTARRMMRIATSERLPNRTPVAVSHDDVFNYATQDVIESLTDAEYEAGIQRGVIRPDTTKAEVVDFKRQIRSGTPHRPRHADIAEPHAPAGVMGSAGAATLTARSYSELVWLLIQRRKLLGITQLDLDQRIGWGDGMTSKLEIPHMQDGRLAGPGTFKDWLQALGVGLQMVAV